MNTSEVLEKSLLTLFTEYRWRNPASDRLVSRFEAFIRANPDCLQPTHPTGHLTASAWVVSPNREQVLLVHHRKLNRWLQPGGHADGNPDLVDVARREVFEETGLARLHLLSPYIFDLDIHPIPASAKMPAHYHYDVRFIFEANPDTPLVISPESTDLRWFPLAQLSRLDVDESIRRMARKTRRFVRRV